MNRTKTLLICLGLLFAATTGFAQMYTVTDLGNFGGTWGNYAAGINASGQVVGSSFDTGEVAWHAFRTAPNSPLNQVTDDLGFLAGTECHGLGINDSGHVVGVSTASDALNNPPYRAFRTAPNSPINPATDDLGTFGGVYAGG